MMVITGEISRPKLMFQSVTAQRKTVAEARQEPAHKFPLVLNPSGPYPLLGGGGAGRAGGPGRELGRGADFLLLPLVVGPE
jgi:hypothetical protein